MTARATSLLSSAAAASPRPTATTRKCIAPTSLSASESSLFYKPLESSFTDPLCPPSHHSILLQRGAQP
jgi:hypothetical protein